MSEPGYGSIDKTKLDGSNLCQDTGRDGNAIAGLAMRNTDVLGAGCGEGTTPPAELERRGAGIASRRDVLTLSFVLGFALGFICCFDCEGKGETRGEWLSPPFFAFVVAILGERVSLPC